MKKTTIKISNKIAAVILFMFLGLGAFAQVGINTTSPGPGSLLDVNSIDKGIFAPRVNIISLSTIAPITGIANTVPARAAAAGLLVYNTNTTTGIGYYYWNGTQWVNFTNGGDEWKLTGNGGTTAGTNFLGTTDNVALQFRTAGIQRFDITTTASTGGAGRLRGYTTANATAPTYSWINNTGTGMFSPIQDALGFSSGNPGAERMRILANGQIAVNRTTAIDAITRLTVGETGANRAIYGSGATFEAIRGEASSGDGVVGLVTTGRGVYGQATSGNGVQGRSQTANAEGGFFLNTVNNGNGLAALGGGGISYSFNNIGLGAAITGRALGTVSFATAVDGEGIAGIGDQLLGLPARPLGIGVVGYGYQTGVYGDSGYYNQIGVHGSGEGIPSGAGAGTGVYGENVGGFGDGVFGESTNVGVRGYGPNGAILESNNVAGYGAVAWNTSTGAGNKVGLLAIGQNLLPIGFPGTAAILYGNNSGGAGFASNNNGTGIIGVGNNGGTAFTPAVGSGVAGTGNTVGVYGKGVLVANGNGVVGVGNGLGTYTVPAIGAGVAGTGVDIGVFGTATNAAGFGIYSNGDSHTQGNITASGDITAAGDVNAGGAKNFVIDDPRDPANKYLKHASIESNEILNLYRGVNTFDISGKAIVQLPDYYEMININPSYQLTPIGAPMPNLYIESEVTNGIFVIAGGVAGQKVSWIVTSERNDPYIRNNPEIRNMVVDKGVYRGSYLAPESYGQPADRGILNKSGGKMRSPLIPVVAKQAVAAQEIKSESTVAEKLDLKEAKNLTTPSKNVRNDNSGNRQLRDRPILKAQKTELSSNLKEKESQNTSGNEVQGSEDDKQIEGKEFPTKGSDN